MTMKRWAMVVKMGIVSVGDRDVGNAISGLDEIDGSLGALNTALADGARVVHSCPMPGVENTALALVVLEQDEWE